MNKERLEYFKIKLLKEKALLEEELKTVAKINPSNPADWEPKRTALDTDHADSSEVADGIEGFETNISILQNLEIKYNEIKSALARIDANTFGVCIVCEKEIEEDRLEANLGASTCKAHL
ncbi:MAG: TraR/DksA C4-type zinc finger protein [Patescibacteria group bacterium]